VQKETIKQDRKCHKIVILFFGILLLFDKASGTISAIPLARSLINYKFDLLSFAIGVNHV
jgi:hypothetical protein